LVTGADGRKVRADVGETLVFDGTRFAVNRETGR